MLLRIQVCVSVLLVIAVVGFRPTRADIYRWDTGELIPGTEGIEPGPGVQLRAWNEDNRNLNYADFSGGLDLTEAEFGHMLFLGNPQGSWLAYANFSDAMLVGADFGRSTLTAADFSRANLTDAYLSHAGLPNANLMGANLTDADLHDATLTSANLTGAIITGAGFYRTVSNGFTAAQLYSTANYREKNLRSIVLGQNDLSGWDFGGQDMTGATLSGATLTGVNLAGAVITGASFSNTTRQIEEGEVGFTAAQLYSTANYQQNNLQKVTFSANDLTGWDFSGQDLAGADLSETTLTGADLAGAVITNARFDNFVDFASQQFYSTASYQAKDLRGIRLSTNNLEGWDFAGQNLTRASFDWSRLDNADFRSANLSNTTWRYGTSLTNANFEGANLAGALFVNTQFGWPADLTGANLTSAVVTGADFGGTTSRGFTPAQLASTASYQAKNLQAIGLAGCDLTSWDFSGQNLTSASLGSSTLTNTDLTGAVVTGANFWQTTSRGFTQTQLSSTDSYQAKDLQGIGLGSNDLTGWDFSGQNLTGAYLSGSTLTNANLSGASLKNAYLREATGLTAATVDAATVYNQWTVFPDDFDPVVAGLTLVTSPSGDFDANDTLDGNDVDSLSAEVRRDGSVPVLGRLPDEMFDLNADGTTDQEDHRIWVKDLANTYFGDANLDGEFSTGDFVQAFQAGKYETRGQAGWGQGDWNGDGVFDTADFVIAFEDGGYEQGPRTNVHAVPEPGTTALLLTATVLLLLRRRAGRRCCLLLLLPMLLAPLAAHADIYRWDTGELIPDTEGIEPGPGLQLADMDLSYADLSNMDLTGASLRGQISKALGSTPQRWQMQT